jgi:hypothetical protein
MGVGMKLFAVALGLLLSVLVLVGSASGQQRANRIWITGATIVSPESLDHIAEGDVLIEGGRIVSVERGKAARKPADAAIVSGKGEFVIPGLIDSHVHLASVPGMPFETSFDPDAAKPAMVREYFKQLPRSYLYFGYTTLIDLAVIDPHVLQDLRHAPLHPDLYDCGPSLPIANGYPMSFAPLALRFELFPNFIYDPKPCAMTSTSPSTANSWASNELACIIRTRPARVAALRTSPSMAAVMTGRFLSRPKPRSK